MSFLAKVSAFRRKSALSNWDTQPNDVRTTRGSDREVQAQERTKYPGHRPRELTGCAAGSCAEKGLGPGPTPEMLASIRKQLEAVVPVEAAYDIVKDVPESRQE